jgi:uncharacterized repeat protein (TIGR03803 family)
MRNTLFFIFLLFLLANNLCAQSVKQLWGTTHAGGTDGGGTIFSLKEDGTGFIKRYDFRVKYQGAYPRHNELLEIGNKFYGTTASAGAYSRGILFEWKLCKKSRF